VGVSAGGYVLVRPTGSYHNPSRLEAPGATVPHNKRMQLTKLRAAPVLQAEVPPCAPAGEMDGGTASQLIASVLRTAVGRA